MPWCPECKYEYVEGIKVCPDCKKALVDSLEDIEDEMEAQVEEYENMYENEEEESDEIELPSLSVMELIQQVQSGQMSPDEFNAIVDMLKQRSIRAAAYKYKKDEMDENSSSVVALIACGVLGMAVLILNAIGVFDFPIKGNSIYLIYGVMGFLFLIFILSGLKSISKVNKLKPEVALEKEKIQECIDYLKERSAAGAYKLNDDEEIGFEEASILISSICVQDLENHFEDLEPGFAFFVVDRYYSDFIDESVEGLPETPKFSEDLSDEEDSEAFEDDTDDATEE